MPIAEVTVQRILYSGRKSPTGKTIPFDALVTAEVGTVSLQKGQVKNFQENRVYEIGYTEKGEYKNDGTFLKDLAKEVPSPQPTVKQYTRPVTAPREAKQIGILALAKIFEPIPTDDLEQMRARGNRVMICSKELYVRHLEASQTQADDEMDDEIPQ